MTSIREAGFDQYLSPHSFVEFTQRPFYRNINRETLSLAPKKVQSAVDIATGTGAIIDLMLEMEILAPDFSLRGYDPDSSALKEARTHFFRYRNQMLFHEAKAENIPLQDRWADLVTFCNAIHLTDAPKAIREATRIMNQGATLLINTAYESTHAYPEGSEPSWGALVALARMAAKKKYGINDIPKPVHLLNYSTDDYVSMLVAAGLTVNEIYFHTVYMDREDLNAICRYDEFAKGALPGVELELAKELLLGAVEPMLERRKSHTLPRGWTIIKARKLPKVL